MNSNCTANPPGEPGPLLAEFGPASSADWRALVEAELKGVPFEKRMVSSTPEGIELRPLYRPEDMAGLAHLGSLPGRAPYVRGTRSAGYAGSPWQITQGVPAADPAGFNAAARAGLGRGATALSLVLDRATPAGCDLDQAIPGDVGVDGMSPACLADWERAFAGIDLAAVPVFVEAGASGLPAAAFLLALAQRHQVPWAALRGAVEGDPLGELARVGRLPMSLDAAYREMAALTAWAVAKAPGLQTIGVHAGVWHEAGGSAVQELGFALAAGVEYLREMVARGLAIEQVAPRVRQTYSVGTRFFMEIAKLRAARLLWSRAVEAAGGTEEAQRPSLHVRTSRFNKTVYDVHSNLLRTSVEALAAVVAGCDGLQVDAFDAVRGTPDAFSERLARNQQLILAEECGLTQVADPTGGSWYVEVLTAELASRAWALFQEVERRGGMGRAMAQGWPQEEIRRVAVERCERVARRRDSIVGVSVYPNPAESVPTADPDSTGTGAQAFGNRRGTGFAAGRAAVEDPGRREALDRLACVPGTASAGWVEACLEVALAGGTLGEMTGALRRDDGPELAVVAVPGMRAAAGFEALRGRVDRQARQSGRRARVFLANLGPPKQYGARADFSRGFLAVAGFDVVSEHGYATVAETAVAALASGADAVCICSTDETYPSLVAPLIRALRAVRPAMPVILAGYPAEQVSALADAGVDEFIHVRADVLATLTSIARRMGIPK